MKNLIILIIISLFALMACNDDFIEKYPEDKINDNNYWSSVEDLQLYANTFYPDLTANNRKFRLDDNSDNQIPTNRNAYVWNESPIPQTGGGWSWENIRNCNYALVRIADMEKNAGILRYEGEIRFFKSFYYFEMIKRFGNLPWFEKDLQTNSEELYKSRDSRKEVFANLLEDLNFAITHLPDERYSDDRLTKYAALAFKTEACLYEGTFRKYHGLGDYEEILRESVNAAEEVINSELFSVYSTGNPDDDYYALFILDELKDNPESIMCQRFLLDIRMNNTARDLSGFNQETGYSQDFVESYLCKDGLPISLSNLYQGDSEFIDQFVNRDPRMSQSIYNPDIPYIIEADGTISYREMPVFLPNEVPSSYYIRKGFPRYATQRDQNQNIIDDFIFRYGELLVSYAEAKAELGECSQEILDKTINLLRDRVNMPHLTVDVMADPSQDWEVPVSPLIHEIRRERRIELCAEGKRWDDLLRWKAGKRLEEPKTILGARDPETGQYRVCYPGYETRTWFDKLYLHPIPKQELALNNNLKQNPGW